MILNALNTPLDTPGVQTQPRNVQVRNTRSPRRSHQGATKEPPRSEGAQIRNLGPRSEGPIEGQGHAAEQIPAITHGLVSNRGSYRQVP